MSPIVAPASHFIIKCTCGNVIAQCRCMGQKTVEIRQHPACGKEPPVSPEAKYTIKPILRRFIIRRDVDHSGVSGTGFVAEGVLFNDGQAVIKWLTHVNSLAIYPSMEALEQIHGHGGDTTIEWIDQ